MKISEDCTAIHVQAFQSTKGSLARFESKLSCRAFALQILATGQWTGLYGCTVHIADSRFTFMLGIAITH